MALASGAVAADSPDDAVAAGSSCCALGCVLPPRVESCGACNSAVLGSCMVLLFLYFSS